MPMLTATTLMGVITVNVGQDILEMGSSVQVANYQEIT